jgi:hypothetical protein
VALLQQTPQHCAVSQRPQANHVLLWGHANHSYVDQGINPFVHFTPHHNMDNEAVAAMIRGQTVMLALLERCAVALERTAVLHERMVTNDEALTNMARGTLETVNARVVEVGREPAEEVFLRANETMGLEETNERVERVEQVGR